MMLLLVKNKLLINPLFNSLIPKTTPTLCFSLLQLLHFSTSLASSDSSPTQNPPPPPKPSKFIIDYLITSCGFSPQKAAIVSKRIPVHLTSPENPDSVRHFFKHLGFADSQTRSLISKHPSILSANVENTLQPNLHPLQSIGFSDHQLRKLVVCNASVLLTTSAIPRLDFWKTFLNGNLNHLFLAFSRNRSLITCDIDKNIIIKICFLKDQGLSESDIRMLVINTPGLIFRSITSLDALIKRTQELGFSPGNALFLKGLSALHALSSDLFTSKMQLFRSFGWSEGEFLTAILRWPCFIRFAKEHVTKKVKFLVEKCGCTQSYIASRPMILAYRLEGRMIPRHYVMKVLESNNLVRRKRDLYAIMSMAEKKFIETMILTHKDEAPTLHETYVAACTREISL